MLRIEKLVKKYGKVDAIDHLTMEVKHGQLFGLVGPNGSGKSSVIKIAAGLLSYDSGSVIVDTIHMKQNPMLGQRKIGYMPDHYGVYEHLTVLEYLKFFASVYHLQGYRSRIRIEELLQQMELKEVQNCMVDLLSIEMKQRLCLARAILPQPQLLMLDEPLTGLEPREKKKMYTLLKKLNEPKNSILISSHSLSDVSEVCTHIGILEKGKLVASGEVASILAKQKEKNPIMLKVLCEPRNALAILKADFKVSNVICVDNQISFSFSGNESEEVALLQQMIAQQVKVISFYRNEGNLEDIFLKLS